MKSSVVLGADKLRIVCGPTAAGKSSLALELCERYHGAIVSADSRQVYCDFDIGTAKPTSDECARIQHYGIDVVDPDERYSAARWADAADEWIECACEIEKVPVVVGGTGLYIRALVDPLFVAPEVDASRRAKLENELEGMSLVELRRWCEELDSARAHLGRTQLVRAIETALLAGERISDLHAKDSEQNAADAGAPIATYLVVDPGDSLRERIANRVDAMLAAGWVDEVRELMRNIPDDAPAWKASGYGVIREHVLGRADLSSARERIIIETRQYAKRQRTWFRHQLPAAAVTILNPEDSDSATAAREWWESAE
jgi:tRNA dimethylallyltransferase